VGRVAELGSLADYRAFMSHRKIQTLRRDSKRWADRCSWAGIVAGFLCFLGIVVVPDSLRVWPETGFFLAFIFILLAWATHYAFIVLDEFIRRHYGTVIFMSAVIAGFGWVIQSLFAG
jgi:uncharacterized membrane protein